jgi:hypothetical protein
MLNGVVFENERAAFWWLTPQSIFPANALHQFLRNAVVLGNPEPARTLAIKKAQSLADKLAA